MAKLESTKGLLQNPLVNVIEWGYFNQTMMTFILGP